MADYILFLRAINVSGKNVVKMQLLKEALETYGYPKPITYIQSGNILISDVKISQEKIKQHIETILLKEFNVETTCLVRKVSEIEEILKNIPFSIQNTKQLYFTFSVTPPSKETLKEIINLDYKGDLFSTSNTCIYIQCINGFGKTKLTNNFFEKKLSTKATTRNYNTLIKMISIAKKDHVTSFH